MTVKLEHPAWVVAGAEVGVLDGLNAKKDRIAKVTGTQIVLSHSYRYRLVSNVPGHEYELLGSRSDRWSTSRPRVVDPNGEAFKKVYRRTLICHEMARVESLAGAVRCSFRDDDNEKATALVVELQSRVDWLIQRLDEIEKEKNHG